MGERRASPGGGKEGRPQTCPGLASQILVQVAWIVPLLVACHLLLTLASLAVFPVPAHIDSAAFEGAVHGNQRRLVTYGSIENGFSQEPTLFLLGASNVVKGFRAPEIQERFPSYAVHNLGLCAANVTELSAVVDMVYDIVPPARRSNCVFLLGMSFTLCIDNEAASRRSKQIIDVIGTPFEHLSHEAARWGFYRRAGFTLEPQLRRTALRAGAFLLRPWFWLERERKRIENRFRFGLIPCLSKLVWEGQFEPSIIMTGRNPMEPESDADDTEERRQARLQFLEWYVATPNGIMLPEQFDEVRRLSKRIEQEGSLLILVDMPQPEWIRTRLPFIADYERQLAVLRSELAQHPHVRFVDLHSLSTPFYNWAYAAPGTSSLWADALRAQLTLPGEQ